MPEILRFHHEVTLKKKIEEKNGIKGTLHPNLQISSIPLSKLQWKRNSHISEVRLINHNNVQ